ncbi:MAG: hypothetical protein JXK07_10075 [Spirochaetes bacterium]|nr:hypothetical protein [Spirochaetota bacterium]MBN2771255.1 hypothetical protein [Spirochaetota bacterium]
METINPKQEYTVYESSRLLSVCPRTVYRYIEYGWIDSLLYPSGIYRITGKALITFKQSSIMRSRIKNNFPEEQAVLFV